MGRKESKQTNKSLRTDQLPLVWRVAVGANAREQEHMPHVVYAPSVDPEGRGGQGVRPPTPLKNHKNIGFLSSSGQEQSYRASIQCCAIISTPAKRHLNGGSLAGRLWPACSGIWIFSSLKYQKKKPVKVGPPLTKFSGSVHASSV